MLNIFLLVMNITHILFQFCFQQEAQGACIAHHILIRIHTSMLSVICKSQRNLKQNILKIINGFESLVVDFFKFLSICHVPLSEGHLCSKGFLLEHPVFAPYQIRYHIRCYLLVLQTFSIVPPY